MLFSSQGPGEQSWAAIGGALGRVEGYNLRGIIPLRNLVSDETGLDDDLSQESPEKRLFFLVEYTRGERIMQQGTYSDYAALYVQGGVRLWQDDPAALRDGGKSCWSAPHRSAAPSGRPGLGSRINRMLTFRKRDPLLPTAPVQSGVAPLDPAKLPLISFDNFANRLMGVTSVVWKQPRSATLLADDEPQGTPCRMLLVKRRLLLDCLLFADRTMANPSPLFRGKIEDFFDQSLPPLLSQNRLFRSLFYVEEVKEQSNWEALLRALAPPSVQRVSTVRRLLGDWMPGPPGGWLRGESLARSGVERIAGLLSDSVRQWLASLTVAELDDAARYRLVSELNDVLKRPDLYQAQAWPEETLQQEERELLAREPAARTLVESYRLNRLLMEQALPGVFESVRNFRPRIPEDFRQFIAELRKETPLATPERPTEGKDIIRQGEPADGLYLILQGRVQLKLLAPDQASEPGGSIIFNHLVEDGFLGENCIEAEARNLYQAVALTNCNLLKIDRRALSNVVKDFPDFARKLQWEAARMRRRAEQVLLGRRLPPAEPPLPVAERLVRATNLLLIDMERCTRCDQCVQGCTASHQGHPRFHRANPEFRFGRWELAGACVHCSDAPCLEACPVGAITLIANGSVQVLRDRCISCRKCEPACPFGVIEYHPPLDAADGASAKRTDYVVSHKCDLCLTKDRDPPCVVACPYGAAKRGTPSNFFPGLRSMARFTDAE
jgi:Fe-S-cluster-containing hydrogenase component 2/CRP-like cAMP-binding protein